MYLNNYEEVSNNVPIRFIKNDIDDYIDSLLFDSSCEDTLEEACV